VEDPGERGLKHEICSPGRQMSLAAGGMRQVKGGKTSNIKRPFTCDLPPSTQDGKKCLQPIGLDK